MNNTGFTIIAAQLCNEINRCAFFRNKQAKKTATNTFYICNSAPHSSFLHACSVKERERATHIAIIIINDKSTQTIQ